LRYGEGKVQTTNAKEAAKAVVVSKISRLKGRAGSIPAPGTR